jgi:hypothetical protein
LSVSITGKETHRHLGEKRYEIKDNLGNVLEFVGNGFKPFQILKCRRIVVRSWVVAILLILNFSEFLEKPIFEVNANLRSLQSH